MEHIDEYYSIINQDNNPYINLLYSRGFLISDRTYTVKKDWVSYIFYENLYVTHDPRLQSVCVKNNSNFVLVLGMVMDTLEWHMEIKKIAEKCLSCLTVNKNLFFDYTDNLCGRYILCYGNKDNQYIIQDATGMRSCVYAKPFFIASHYGILNDIIHDEHHPIMETYLNIDTEKRPWLLPGNLTPNKNIFCLCPNHELHLNDMSVKRFWPRKPHEDISAEEATDCIINNIRGQIITLSRYYKLMFQMTKGNDSRISLAASKPIKDTTLYYSYYSDNVSDQVKDAKFCSEYAKSLGLNHILLHVDRTKYDSYDMSMLQSVLRNNHYHPHLYSAVYEFSANLPKDRLNIRSNLIEIIRKWHWGDDRSASRSEVVHWFCLWADYTDSNLEKEVVSIFERYYDELQYNDIYNYSYSDLFYWEYRIGLWLNNGVLLKDDVNFDTYMLFNCRKILEYGLSMPRYFKDSNMIVYKTIEKLWPEVIQPLPNTDNKLIDYFDYSSLNKLQIKGNHKISSNLPDKELFYKIGVHNATLGFGKNSVKKGDYVELKIDFPVKNTYAHIFQLHLKCNWLENSYNNTKCHYEIFVDKEKIYDMCIGNFMNKVNQINAIKGFASKGNHCLTIRLCADCNIDDGITSAGIIHVEEIAFCHQYNYKIPEKTVVTSTCDVFSKLELR